MGFSECFLNLFGGHDVIYEIRLVLFHLKIASPKTLDKFYSLKQFGDVCQIIFWPLAWPTFLPPFLEFYSSIIMFDWYVKLSPHLDQVLYTQSLQFCQRNLIAIIFKNKLSHHLLSQHQILLFLQHDFSFFRFTVSLQFSQLLERGCLYCAVYVQSVTQLLRKLAFSAAVVS